MSKKLSVIISNRNDTVMLAVTVRSCIEAFQPLGAENCEVVIVDNSDECIYKLLPSVLPTGYCKEGLLKISHQPFPCLFSARDEAAQIASGQYIACLDSHMLVGHNTFYDLVSFMDRHKSDTTLAFAHAPISWAHHHERAARHDRDMSTCELGDWNKHYDHERTITWKGMPWICRRDWYLNDDSGLNGYGALSKHKISWGGGDMHIGIKPWLLGFKNWAVPTRPCIHIGPFPKIDLGADNSSSPAGPDKYRLYNSSGNYPHTFGFLVSCYILGGEPMMRRNESILNHKFGKYLDIKKWWPKAIELGQEERDWLLKRQKMSFEQLLHNKPWNS